MKFLSILLLVGFVFAEAELNPTSFVNVTGDQYKKVILLKVGPAFSKDAGSGVAFAANYSLILDEMTLAGIEINMINNDYYRTVQDGTLDVLYEYEAFYFPITLSVSHKLPWTFKNKLYPVIGFGLGYTLGYNFEERVSVVDGFGNELGREATSVIYDDKGTLKGLTWNIITGALLKLGTRTDLFVNFNYVNADLKRLNMSGMTIWTGLLFNMR